MGEANFVERLSGLDDHEHILCALAIYCCGFKLCCSTGMAYSGECIAGHAPLAASLQVSDTNITTAGAIRLCLPSLPPTLSPVL